MAGNIVVSASRAGAESGPAAPSVQIDAWQPDRPYLELYDGKPADFAERFREAEARHGALPIFYLDTAAWLAGAIILLMLVATGAVVMLAARAGLEAHRATIEVIHMLGATDRQVARLFQRRIALDAGIGAVAGSVIAGGAILLIARQVGALESELLGGLQLGVADLGMLTALPFGFVALAVVAARLAVLRQMRRML